MLPPMEGAPRDHRQLLPAAGCRRPGGGRGRTAGQTPLAGPAARNRHGRLDPSLPDGADEQGASFLRSGARLLIGPGRLYRRLLADRRIKCPAFVADGFERLVGSLRQDPAASGAPFRRSGRLENQSSKADAFPAL